MRDQKVPTEFLFLIIVFIYFCLGCTYWPYFLSFLLILQGELQYFIGVQLDGSDHVEPLRNRLSEKTEQQSAKIVCNFSLLFVY